MKQTADVIVIGGGPAGATASALLAEKGHDVVVIEKSKFPRYHVGESLMPFCYHTLDRLGLVEEMDKLGFTQKFSVQFVTQDGKQSRPFYFFQHYDHPSSTTWQVLRSQFDSLILNKARDNGATVYELTQAKSLIEDNGTTIGVQVTGADGQSHEIMAPMVIDASGRDSLVQTKNKWRKRDPVLNKIAIWTYFKGALRDPGLDAGSTTVAYIPDKGWFWYIPLAGDIVSLGVVADRDYLYRNTRDPEQIIKEEIKNNVWISEHLKPGRQFGRYWTTGEYSYRSEFCASNGLLLAGDAFAFLDPVFSSGVFLALKSGEMAADAVHHAILNNDYQASQFSEYGRELCEGIEAMRALVYAFYDQGFSFADLVKEYPDVRGDLTDCLIGNLSTDFSSLFEAVSNFASLPSKLEHGKVLASA